MRDLRARLGLPAWANALAALVLIGLLVGAFVAGRSSIEPPAPSAPPSSPGVSESPTTPGAAPTQEPERPAEQTFEVTRIVDGDTIDVRVGSETRRVRYIGMDTPERDACYFREATEKNRELVGAKSVSLVKDVSETDRYGRLLRYVYVGTMFVNAELVKQGYANVSTYPPDVEHAQQFLSLEREARAANRGLWDPKVCAEAATPSGGPVEIGKIHYDAAGNDNYNLNDEWIEILNGGGEAVSLRDWSLGDAAHHDYRFPGFTLAARGSVKVHTGSGSDTSGDLYWGSSGAVWNNDGDTATLEDASGRVVARKTY